MNTDLTILTASYINSLERYHFSKKAFKSVIDSSGNKYPTIVIDDSPRFSQFTLPFYKRFLDGAVNNVYKNNKTTIIRRPFGSKGSTSALLDGVKLALLKGYNYGFIHLDDNIYIPALKKLLNRSINALDNNKNLQLVRLTGRPILSHLCNPKDGNTSNITINKKTVTFEQVELKPKRHQDYTLWKTRLHPHIIQNYWAISMWSTVYRLEYLEKLLKTPAPEDVFTLGKVEVYYQDSNNWKKFLKKNPGELGYINMQFCGLEMQRNRNWSELVTYPNKPIL